MGRLFVVGEFQLPEGARRGSDPVDALPVALAWKHAAKMVWCGEARRSCASAGE